jgi:hypothetical protein
MAVIETERSAGGEVSCLVRLGRTLLKLALRRRRQASRFSARRPIRSIAEDRKRFAALLEP